MEVGNRISKPIPCLYAHQLVHAYHDDTNQVYFYRYIQCNMRPLLQTCGIEEKYNEMLRDEVDDNIRLTYRL